ncbi:MAG: hypothetical protein ACI9TH_003942 [Kiritimatiellia bacterium]|jgi:hypothetical protein
MPNCGLIRCGNKSYRALSTEHPELARLLLPHPEVQAMQAREIPQDLGVARRINLAGNPAGQGSPWTFRRARRFEQVTNACPRCPAESKTDLVRSRPGGLGDGDNVESTISGERN